MKTASTIAVLAIASSIASTTAFADNSYQAPGDYRAAETRSHAHGHGYYHYKHPSGPATVNQAPFKSES
jgi:hypothetical protein